VERTRRTILATSANQQQLQIDRHFENCARASDQPCSPFLEWSPVIQNAISLMRVDFSAIKSGQKIVYFESALRVSTQFFQFRHKDSNFASDFKADTAIWSET